MTAFSVGGEHDFLKSRELSGHLDIPILGVNEIFDLDGKVFTKAQGVGIVDNFLDFPLTLSDPHERFPISNKYINYIADRQMHYGHVFPNVNLFLVDKDKIMKGLSRNRLNPTKIG